MWWSTISLIWPWPNPLMRFYDYNPDSRLHCYRALMAIDNQYDGEVVDGGTNFLKEGDSRVTPGKSYRQVKSPRGGSLLKYGLRSQPRSISRSRPWFYGSRLYRPRTMKLTEMSNEKSTMILLKSPMGGAYLWSRPEGHRSGLRRMITESWWIYKSTSQWRVPMTTGCKIYSTEHAGALRRA